MIHALTRNLGYRTSSDRWLRDELGQSDLDACFLQEVPNAVVSDPPHGYRALPGRTAPRACEGRTSVLLIRDGFGEAEVPEVPKGIDDARPFASLGTYVSYARVVLATDPVWFISVHTSPSEVAAGKRRDEFRTRTCERVPFWSDAFVAELAVFMQGVEDDVVLAGDLNQALAYDAAINHTCGGELLAAIAALGFVDTTVRDWGEERPTRVERPYHLDRVFASSGIADDVSVDLAELAHDGHSDHAAVRFSIDRG